MNIPLSWLREYVSLEAIGTAELAERLTLAGLEVAGARVYGVPVPPGLRVKPEDAGIVWERDKVVTAQVLQVSKHPNADKLKLVTLDYGAGQPKTVVTGAPNLQVGDSGQKVILGQAGTLYWDGHTTPKKLAELKPKELRGIPNDAMVMSNFELGINEEHEGIIILEADAPVGVPAQDLLGEVVLEVELTPNLARCYSLIGIAREVAALTGQRLRLPPHQPAAAGQPIGQRVRVAIEDPQSCSRYLALLIEGVQPGPTPGWMRRRLEYAGMRSLGLIVDITNYVMLEWGQPLHAFDYDKLLARANGQAVSITVRSARPGEKLLTLDQQERTLTPEHLVIADARGPIALAGVMGGLETEVGPDTRTVLLESANFDLVRVRRAAREFNLHSEASLRFSKGIHPAIVPLGAGRAAYLLEQHAQATTAAGCVDEYPAPPSTSAITLSEAEIRRLLGVSIPLDEASHTLQLLEFEVRRQGDVLEVLPPPHRLDIQAGPADLIEELARLRGYDHLPATLLACELPAQRDNAELAREERTRDILVSLGLQEVITYAMTAPERETLLTGQTEGVEYVRLANPISAERSVMRRELLPGVLEVAATNLRHCDTVRLFEVGRVFLPVPHDKLPHEPLRLAVVMTGRRTPNYWDDPLDQKPALLDFFDLKGVLEAMLDELHLGGVEVRAAKRPHLHPGRAAELRLAEQVVGTLGELHPKTAQAFDLTERAVLVAELDLDTLLAQVPARFAARAVPRFPAALRDIAVIVAEEVPAGRVEAEIRAAGGELVSAVRLFDVYRGPSIPAGTKSLAYALVYQASDRTLKDAEVDKAHKKIMDRLRHLLQAKIRGIDVVTG